MAGNVSFRLSPTFEDELMLSPWMRELLAGASEAVKTSARALAPRLRGFLIEDIEADVGMVDGRITGRVWSSDFKTIWHEFGTRKMHPHPFLFPALVRTLPGATITGGDKPVR